MRAPLDSHSRTRRIGLASALFSRVPCETIRGRRRSGRQDALRSPATPHPSAENKPRQAALVLSRDRSLPWQEIILFCLEYSDSKTASGGHRIGLDSAAGAAYDWRTKGEYPPWLAFHCSRT